MSNAAFTNALNGVFTMRSCMDAERREILSRVERELDRLGWSWGDLAKAMNESPQRVNNYTHRGITEAMHARVATALGWTVDQLLGREPLSDGLGWPFPDVPAQRFRRLTLGEQLAVQWAMIDKMAEIEAAKAGKSGPPRRRPKPPSSRKRLTISYGWTTSRHVYPLSRQGFFGCWQIANKLGSCAAINILLTEQ